MPTDQRLRWIIKPLLFIACLVPFAVLLHGTVYDGLGANPIERVTHVTGDWALRFLLVTLAMTPLRRLTGQAWPMRIRRMLGLFVFFYASLHFLTWAWLDQQWLWAQIVQDIGKRPYVTVGFAAWLLLIPLALTSNRWSIRRLGKRWASLHRLVYLVAVFGVLHFLWLVKADLSEPLVYAVILVLLLVMRTPWGSRPMTR
jgi:sulfoxide reductase heme-binding subunit YedZ